MSIELYFDTLLKTAVERGASDIHINIGSGQYRINGTIVQSGLGETLKPADTAMIAARVLIRARRATPETVKDVLSSLRDEDCSYSAPGIGRFRVNICSQRGSLALVLRAISARIPTIGDLGLPAVLADIAMEERGLVLVTGITGSGKTTTLAAMLEYINCERGGKIVTIEDPIEFLYQNRKASIVQREVGADTDSFAKAMRAAMRQDPDIILVGEMRDRETIDAALKAAETGHLVFSTVHTTDVSKTVMRIVSYFDLSEETVIRLRMAEALRAIISQRLLVRADGKGRVPAVEIMRTTMTIRDCIENADKASGLRDYIEKGREQYGMQTFDQHLIELYRSKKINLEEARAAATSPADFERNLQYT
ncbi:MAG: type IV pilus twitching motility protein PilT [Acidobacteriota bacterium]